MPLFCRDKGSEDGWWVWAPIQGRAGAHPSLSNLSPRDHKGVFAKAALREVKYNGFSICGCVWISKVCVGREACACPSPLSTVPYSPAGNSPSLPAWPPCGHGVVHGQNPLWDPVTAPETPKEWLLCLIRVRQSRRISSGQTVPAQRQQGRDLFVHSRNLTLQHRRCHSCSGQLGETKEMLRGNWTPYFPPAQHRDPAPWHFPTWNKWVDGKLGWAKGRVGPR